MARPAPRLSLLVGAALFAALMLGACTPAEQAAPAVAEPPASPPAPLRVGAEAFATLRWLEGRWVGAEPDGAPFYEGYRFANDSTVRTYTFPDSTGLTPSDSGSVDLRAGVVSTGSDGARWVVTELEDGRVHFAPVRNARNSFTWERRPSGGWTATLAHPATGDRPAREVVYEMRRLAP